MAEQGQDKQRPAGYYFKEPKEPDVKFYRLTAYQVGAILRLIASDVDWSLRFNDKSYRYDHTYVTVYNIGDYARLVCYQSNKAVLQKYDEFQYPYRYANKNKKRLRNNFDRLKTLFEEIATDKKRLPPSNNKVFIAHGRQHDDRDYIAGMLMRWGVEPVILSNNIVKGSPSVLEAIEVLIADVDCGIVIETPDEYNGRLVDGRSMQGAGKRRSFFAALKDRLCGLFRIGRNKGGYNARPNVVLEAGMLLGRLSHDSVIRLRAEGSDFNMPSDVEGQLRIEYTDIADRAVMFQLWNKLVLRGFIMKRFDFAGCHKDAIIEIFRSREDGVVMPEKSIAKNKRQYDPLDESYTSWGS